VIISYLFHLFRLFWHSGFSIHPHHKGHIKELAWPIRGVLDLIGVHIHYRGVQCPFKGKYRELTAHNPFAGALIGHELLPLLTSSSAVGSVGLQEFIQIASSQRLHCEVW